MKYVECKFCGARLILGAEVPAPEVRCKRCGRHTPTDRAKPLPTDARPQARPIPTIAPAAPRQAAPPTRAPEQPRYAPDPVHGVPRGAAGFAGSTQPGAKKGRTLALVALMLLVLGGGGVSTWMALGAGAQTPKGRDVGTRNPPPSAPASGAVAPPPAMSQASATPDPTPGPPPTPATPPAQAGATQPPIQGPGRTRSRFGPTDGLAAQIDLEPAFNKVVYANTEIALRDIERERLRLPEKDQCKAWFIPRFADYSVPDPRADAERWGKLDEKGREIKWILQCRAKFRRVALLRDFRLSEQWLFDSRPALSVLLRNVPPGTQVKLELRITDKDPASQLLLSKPQATAEEIVALKTGEPGVWWHQDRQAWEVGLEPQWNERELVKLRGDFHKLNVEVKAWYYDADGQIFREKARTEPIRIAPVSYIEQGYPLVLGAAGLASESHPLVLDLINKVDRERIQGLRAGGANASPGGTLMSMFFIWRELRSRNLAYSNIAAAPEQAAQDVRPIHDSLASKNANCLDGSVLIAAILQKLGLDVDLVVLHDHALICVRCGGIPTGLETTALERNDPCDDETLGEYLAWYEDVGSRDNTLKKVYERMTANEKRDFRVFLKAVQKGDRVIDEVQGEMLNQFAKNGEVKSWPDMFARLEAFEQRAEAGMMSDPCWDTWPKALELSFINISKCRAAGVAPIPAPDDVAPPAPKR